MRRANYTARCRTFTIQRVKEARSPLAVNGVTLKPGRDWIVAAIRQGLGAARNLRPHSIRRTEMEPRYLAPFCAPFLRQPPGAVRPRRRSNSSRLSLADLILALLPLRLAKLHAAGLIAAPAA